MILFYCFVIIIAGYLIAIKLPFWVLIMLFIVFAILIAREAKKDGGGLPAFLGLGILIGFLLLFMVSGIIGLLIRHWGNIPGALNNLFGFFVP